MIFFMLISILILDRQVKKNQGFFFAALRGIGDSSSLCSGCIGDSPSLCSGCIEGFSFAALRVYSSSLRSGCIGDSPSLCSGCIGGFSFASLLGDSPSRARGLFFFAVLRGDWGFFLAVLRVYFPSRGSGGMGANYWVGPWDFVFR